ncbi:MAG: protoglobin family protein [Candidatus Rokubacteria bacterium]|nr:protoglobin family protein [Candidatus Rokubacteria bacterium]
MDGDARQHPAADLPRYTREMSEFVGLDEADIAAIRASAPFVLRHEAALTAALYDHFLRFPAAARFFLGADGQPDRERLERRKHSLGRWLRETAEAAMGHGFAHYLLGVGIAHSHRDYGPGGKIPPQLMIGALSLTQTAIARLLETEMDDPGVALAASIAWNKLLLVHLSVLLLGYFLPPAPVSDAGR